MYLSSVFASHLHAYVFKPMKRTRRAAKSSTRGAGWTGESYQESDSEDEQGQQPQQCPKDLHPHVIVNATPSGTQSSFVNAFTHLGSQPKPVPKVFEFVDTAPSNDNDGFINASDFEMNMESFFQEYGLMDPELSTAWDEDHGLKAKRAHTASVSKFVV